MTEGLVVILGWAIAFALGWGVCSYKTGREIDRLKMLADGRLTQWMKAIKAKETDYS